MRSTYEYLIEPFLSLGTQSQNSLILGTTASLTASSPLHARIFYSRWPCKVTEIHLMSCYTLLCRFLVSKGKRTPDSIVMIQRDPRTPKGKSLKYPVPRNPCYCCNQRFSFSKTSMVLYYSKVALKAVSHCYVCFSYISRKLLWPATGR